jgi:Condensation domain
MTVELPLLAGQSSIWVAEQLGTHGHPYNLRWAQTYDRDLIDEDAAMAALSEIVARHGALQGRIVSNRGVASQRLDSRPAVETIRCGAEDPAGTTTVDQLMSVLATRDVDIEQGPLSEFYVVSARDRTHIVANQHHILSDGQTRSIIATELDDLIHRRSTDHVTTDYVSAVEEALELEQSASAGLQVALDELSSADVGPLRWDADPETEGFGIEEQFVPAAGDALAAAAESSGVGIAAFIIVASAASLGPWLPRGPTVVALVASARPPRARNVAGCFVNSIPVVVPPGLGCDRAGLASAAAAIRHAARLRHLPMARIAAGARRRGLDLSLGEHLLVSIGELCLDADLSAPFPRGCRQGATTIRVWRVNSDAALSIESHRSMMSDEGASQAMIRLSAALEVLTRP